MSPRDLIETARRWTEPGAPPPPQADLRRAVSTAYYTLFYCFGRRRSAHRQQPGTASGVPRA